MRLSRLLKNCERNSPIKAHQINLQRSLIDGTINRFAGVGQLFWVCGRHNAELAELRQSVRIPIVLVTHDIEEAAALADRLCVIDHVELLQTGRSAKLKVAPANPRVAIALDRPEAERVV